MSLRDRIQKPFRSPDGWFFRHTGGFVRRSRQKKYELFQKHLAPQPTARILDVGAVNHPWRFSNFLERLYPYPGRIVAVSLQRLNVFRVRFLDIPAVQADGRFLPFGDQCFDIVFSNAVVEHVGTHESQRRFVHELLRVGRSAYITTPNRYFPLDSHTMLPFVHFLPQNMRPRIYTLFGKRGWADPQALNMLSGREFRALFPPGVPVRMLKQRTLGLCYGFIAIVGFDEGTAASKSSPQETS